MKSFQNATELAEGAGEVTKGNSRYAAEKERMARMAESYQEVAERAYVAEAAERAEE